MISHIMLIHYRGDPIARLIRFFIHSYWNHCAWILGEDKIIECKRYGIGVNSIKKYFKFDYAILQIDNLTEKQYWTIVSDLFEKRGRKSYFKFLLSCFLLATGYKGKLPRETCSGFIANACAKAGIYFREDKEPSRITPKDIYTSNKVSLLQLKLDNEVYKNEKERTLEGWKIE